MDLSPRIGFLIPKKLRTWGCPKTSNWMQLEDRRCSQKYPHRELVNGIVKTSPMSWNSSLGWFQKHETWCDFEKMLDSSSRIWIQKMKLCQPTITSHNQLTLWPSYPPGWSPFHLVRFRHASGSTTACRCKPLLCDTETLERFLYVSFG